MILKFLRVSSFVLLMSSFHGFCDPEVSTSNDSIQYYLEQAKQKYQDNFQEALVSTQLAEKIAVENNYDDVPEINFTYAGLFYVNGNYSNSLKYFLKAVSGFKNHNDVVGESKSYAGIGLIQQAIDRHEVAILYFDKAISLIEDDKFLLSSYYFNKSISYLELHNLRKAKQFLDRSHKFAVESNRKGVLHKIKNRKAQLLFLERKFEKSKQAYQDLLSNSKELSNWEKSFAYAGLAEVNLALEQFSQAEKNALKAYRYAKITNSYWDLERNTGILSDIYQKIGDTIKRDFYAEENIEYRDSLYNDKQLDQINLLQLEYQEEENKLLSYQKAASEKKLMIIKILFIIVVVKTIIGLVFFLRLRKANRQKSLLNKELSIKNEQLNKINQSKNKMFSILSHDLKSPMSSLLQLIELLKEGAFSEEEQKEVLKEMHMQLSSTSLMLRNLLKWATNQMENNEVNLKKVDLIDKVNEVVDVYFVIARNKNVTIAHESNGLKQLLIYVDPAHLSVILHNLLSNAVKFTPENDLIKISYAEQEKNACLKIFNAGEPIKENKITEIKTNQTKIVSEFGTFNEHGTGIGLLLVKQYLLSNNATLEINPIEGKGTEFVICFQKV